MKSLELYKTQNTSAKDPLLTVYSTTFASTKSCTTEKHACSHFADRHLTCWIVVINTITLGFWSLQIMCRTTTIIHQENLFHIPNPKTCTFAFFPLKYYSIKTADARWMQSRLLLGCSFSWPLPESFMFMTIFTGSASNCEPVYHIADGGVYCIL